MNRFLWRHPNWGVLIIVGGLSGAVIGGGMLADMTTGDAALGVLAVVVFLIFGMMALAGNRHLS